MKNKFLICILFILVITNIYCYEDINGSNLSMSIRTGYRDLYSIDTSFVNPASLPLLQKKLSFSIFNSKYYYNFNNEFDLPEKNLLSIYQPFEYEGGIQLFLNNFDSKVGYSENTLGINYGQKYKNFYLGLGTSFYFQKMDIWNELENSSIEYSKNEFFLDFGIIWNFKKDFYLSSSVKALNSDEHINYDNGITYKNKYGTFFFNNHTYKNEFDEFENQMGIGYLKSFINDKFIPSIGINFDKSINAGFSINYHLLNFNLAYQNEFNNNFYDKLSFGFSLKFDYDWYAEKKDVIISKNDTNIFHFIVITKNKVKIKDKWIKAIAVDSSQKNTYLQQISIKSNINNKNIKKAYLYLRIPANWIENKNISKDKLKIDMIINNQRKSLPIFFLYKEGDYYYYMTISDQL
ncbi:MAG: hypothetical protein FXF47_07975 [Candidatus Mcinerneyibacterium aminivorans]|uniref:Uncharacterized protein n=1 Tax=Candidatus Mcinerneyibacterium aminivorans TaxID=2703815 RepID=A0A5D0MA97_9BACT|nr:MAG: hypothetical protein FXF47_07975 [Candidatus Mcinerneyibacterium aminivorans]